MTHINGASFTDFCKFFARTYTNGDQSNGDTIDDDVFIELMDQFFMPFAFAHNIELPVELLSIAQTITEGAEDPDFLVLGDH